MTEIVCDSSSLISLGDNCSLHLIPLLKEKHGVKFMIPKGVEEEIVKRPLKTKRFKLKAIRLRNLLREGYIEKVDSETIDDYSKRFAKLGNSLLSTEGQKLKIIHKGEIETIAALKYLGTNNLLIDERTTRLLIENIDMLKEYMGNQMKKKIKIDEETKKKIKVETRDINIMRSSEIIALAYEEGYLKEKTKEMLEASLYGVKFAGCSIRNKEIKDYLKMIG